MRAWVLLGVVSVLGTACGPDCQSSCQRLFAASGECQLAIPGQDANRSYTTCVKGCEAALDQAGTVGTYNPYVQNTTGASIQLENEKQAALWMQCVDETSCEDIDHGYCAPLLPNP